MKSLIIAEKPSVARDIAAAMGKVSKKNDWYENDELVISSAVGHLVELFMPEDIDKKLRYWKLDTLPIIPEQFQVKPIEKTKTKFDQLKKLLGRKDIDVVINGCDAGREGELIFTYIYELAGCKKPVKRLWMQSMTPEGIRLAFKNLREESEMVPLRDAARCRSESDWLIGINGTRAITSRMYGSRRGSVATVGRVQTPTLALVVERELEIRNFVPRAFWKVTGEFEITNGIYSGTLQRTDFQKSDDVHDKPDRFWNKEQIKQFCEDIRKQPTGIVTDEKKRTRQAPPRLFDLTTLQREANNRFGMAAGMTLRIAQALYEKHKLITYPRTDAKALPEDYIPVCHETLRNIDSEWEPLAQKVLENNWVRKDKKIFNNKEISDHFAIIPTPESSAGKKLSPEETKIYDTIVRRFIAVFYPSAEYDVTQRSTQVGPHLFKTEGKVLAIAGWLEVMNRQQTEKDVLPALHANDGKPAQAKLAKTTLEEEATKPPPRFNDATLLSAMETAGKQLDDEELAEAMKGKGLGTPATRAQTIDHLVNEQYMERLGRDLHPTPKAESLIDFLKAVDIQSLVSAKLTGDWEFKLKQIEMAELNRATFMEGISEHARRIVDKARNFKEDLDQGAPTALISPTDQKPMLDTLRTIRSQDGAIVIYKTIGNRRMELAEIEQLIRERKIGPLDGFRSKLGRPYSAILKLSQENKIEFDFARNGNGTNGENADGTAQEPLDLTACPIIGKSPADGSPVYEAPNAYGDERALNGNREGFRISRTLLGKTLPKDQVVKLLETGKTDLIEGFKSSKTKRFFSAILTLKGKNGIGFEFPPREAKAKKTAKKAQSEPTDKE
jgi:DNA topoisomerase-3